MKIILKILYWIIILLLVLNLLLWGIYNGSGHKIPEETNDFFKNNSIYLFISVIILYVINHKKKKSKSL